MILARTNSHSFILRVWAETREIDGALPSWRGLIQHVRTGAHRYFRDLEEIQAFVRPYLEKSENRNSPPEG